MDERRGFRVFNSQFIIQNSKFQKFLARGSHNRAQILKGRVPDLPVLKNKFKGENK